MRLLPLKPIMEQLQLQIPIQPDWSEFRQATLSKTLSNVSSGSCSSVTTTAMEEEVCRWDDELDGLPVFDWETFIGGDDFAGLFESMMGETGETLPEMSLSLSNSSQPGSGTSEESGSVSMEIEPPNDDDSKGLRLVHLLMAAAEAITGPNKSRDLACVILVRLKELVSRTKGSNMERLAAYFTEGLRCLIEGNSVPKNHHHPPWPNHRENHQHGDVLAAFQLLQDMSPYVKFGHFTANQAILEAVACERRVHIVDYDIMEGIQWASLMQALVSKKDGPPPPHLRITALTRGQNGRKSISSVQETGRRLLAFAASIGQPFSFHQCRLDSDEHFRPSALKLVKGEALVVNCMLHIPHLTYRTPDSVVSFLEGVKSLNPRVVTLVEEEVEPYGEGFVGRFMDSLHHYSALYDSMEAGFPMQGRARALVEQVFLGPRIAASLAYMYRWHGRVNKGWSEWMDESGFKPIQITFFNHCQAKLLLGLFNDGYKVEESANRLVLGWKSRSLLSASVWSAPLEP